MLKFEGRKRQHDADAFMADIVAKRLVRYLERARLPGDESARRSAGIRRLGGDLSVRSKSNQLDWFDVLRTRTVALHRSLSPVGLIAHRPSNQFVGRAKSVGASRQPPTLSAGFFYDINDPTL